MLRPLEKVYWLRLGLGIVAALVCTGYVVLLVGPSRMASTWDTTILFNGASLAIIVYLLSYYGLIKTRYSTGVQKPQKLVTTGIGIYVLSWIVFWVLLYTLIAG